MSEKSDRGPAARALLYNGSVMEILRVRTHRKNEVVDVTA